MVFTNNFGKEKSCFNEKIPFSSDQATSWSKKSKLKVPSTNKQRSYADAKLLLWEMNWLLNVVITCNVISDRKITV